MPLSNLLEIFKKKKTGFDSPWLQLTVVYATARDGLTPDQAYVLRGKVLAAGAIQFEIIEPASFLLFYSGNEAGLKRANALAETMRQVAREQGIPAFGVAVQQGECLAQRSESGRFLAKPSGPVIPQSAKLAAEFAEAAGSQGG